MTGPLARVEHDQTCAGIAAGIVGALALTRVLSGLLFGVSATDPLTALRL